MIKVTAEPVHFWGTKAITAHKNNLQTPLDYLLTLSHEGIKKKTQPSQEDPLTGRAATEQ